MDVFVIIIQYSFMFGQEGSIATGILPTPNIPLQSLLVGRTCEEALSTRQIVTDKSSHDLPSENAA